MNHLVLTCLTIALLGTNAVADNWPSWRGPIGTGVAEAGAYPMSFSDEENVVWKVELPGRGSSTPAVWGEQIYVTGPIDGKDGIVAYDMEGIELWRESFGPETNGKHRNGSGSNPSPVTDGEHVVVYYKSGTVACLTTAGELRWTLNLQEKYGYGQDSLWWDLGTSPVIASGNAIVAVMHDNRKCDSFLVALDLATGDVAWKQPRVFDCEEESDQSYTTPRVIKLGGKEVLVTFGADHLTGHDTSTGEQLWQCGGFNPENKIYWRVIASAAVDDKSAIVPYGRGDFLAAIDLQGAEGDITSSHRLWEKVQMGADVPTPVLDDEKVILLTDKGFVYALDRSNGEQLWEDRFPKAKGKYYASPTLAGNQLFCAREDGVVMSCRLDGGLHDLKENDMGESVIATPIAIQDKLLIRGEKHLFLIGQ